jgi:bifunctional N-acetylglucosamine-1-phosphate-uridyltransferase/glucosamine-1-phosphate-acetyltransferase GlmU-like protein
MASWAGIALALAEPGHDEMGSRLPTYLHPLAGRPLVWHTLSALASVYPAPSRLGLAADEELAPELFGEFTPELHFSPLSGQSLWQTVTEIGGDTDNVLLVDAAAPAVGGALQRLVDGPADRALLDTAGRATAVWLSAACAAELLPEALGLVSLSDQLAAADLLAAADVAFAVRDRASLARAAALVRDRLVARLMSGGVTFLIPETVLIDVDVRIGRDTVIYPGVVLEGQTNIGEETVIGPGCRIIDSWVGSGVELKGWNYISRTSVRNRAILEPYVRRGFD